MVSRPGPPQASGIIMPQQPRAASLRISSAGNFSWRSRWVTEGRTSASMNWRTVSRISFWWSLSEKSIGSGVHRMLTQEGGLPNLGFRHGENGVKVSKETSGFVRDSDTASPYRRLWTRFHNRAEDDTSFAARQLRGGRD